MALIHAMPRLAILSLLVSPLLMALQVRADTRPAFTPQSLTDAQATAAIDRGIAFVLKDVDQKIQAIKNSKVPLNEPQIACDAGELMLQTYALLYAGTNSRDKRLGIHEPRMEFLIELLKQADFKETYHTSLQTLALSQLPQTAEVRAAITRTANKLVKGRGAAGGYSYLLDGTQSTIYDGSNSQYGLLGVWAAADWGGGGVKIDPAYWKTTDAFWRSFQSPTGAWPYRAGEAVRPSMTAAGVASLFVCDEFLNRSVGLEPRSNTPIVQGLTALLTEFKPDTDDLYYLYGVERCGLASGAKFFGRHNWYRQIAANLLNRQNQDGSFGGTYTGANAVRNTCYAILILGRGRAPVVMNKLQYDGPWNARARDSANLHSYLTKTFERHLNWQSVPLSAFAEEWLDAPMILITGSKDPNFTSDDIDKLREYIHYGGLIFSTSDGESKEFTEAMARYAGEMLTSEQEAPAKAWRELPPDHPIFTVMGKIENPPPLWGLTNGVRELWIHSPQDLGAVWQTYNTKRKEAWDTPAAILFYMAGKEGLRSRLQTLAVPAPEKPPERKVTVARIRHAANWDPEPGAWSRLSRLLAADADMDMTLKPVSITGLPKMSPLPQMAHLAGTTRLTLTEDQKKALRDYIAAGGTLFVEAIGGSEEFATSAAEQLKFVFPESKLKLVPPDYLLYTGNFTARTAQITEVEYRRYWVLRHGAMTAPRIQYMNINKRAAVFFSSEDLTSGLLGTNAWAIGGYTPESATAIARNLVLYSWRNFPKKKEQ